MLEWRRIVSLLRKVWPWLLTAHGSFLVIALVFGFTIVKITPPLWGVDEVAHFARAYGVSQGNMMADKLPNGHYGAALPSNIYNLSARVYDNMPRNTNIPLVDRKDVPDRHEYDQFTDKELDVQQTQQQFTGAAAYSPVAYAGPAIGIALAHALDGTLGALIFMGRLGGLLVFAALIYAALYVLRANRFRWVLFIIALLPMTVFQGAIISPDSLAIGTAILLLSLVIRLITDKTLQVDWRITAVLAALAIILPLAKPNYWLLALPVLLIPAWRWGTVRKGWTTKLAIVGGGLLVMGLWAFIARDITALVNAANNLQFASQVHTGEQLSFLVHHPLSLLQVIIYTLFNDDNYFMTTGMFGTLGANLVRIPLVIVGLLVAALVIATFSRDKEWLPRYPHILLSSPLLIGLFGVGTIASIFGLFYLTYTPVAYPTVMGVQGRYFIPALPFILYGVRYALPITVRITTQYARLLFPVVATFCLLVSYVIYYKALY